MLRAVDSLLQEASCSTRAIRSRENLHPDLRIENSERGILEPLEREASLAAANKRASPKKESRHERSK